MGKTLPASLVLAMVCSVMPGTARVADRRAGAAHFRHRYLRRLRRRAGARDDSRTPVARGLQAAGRHDQRRSRAGCPVRRRGQYVLRSRKYSDRCRRQRRRGRKEPIPRPWSMKKTAIITAFPINLLSARSAPSGNGCPAQDSGRPARSLGRHRPGRVFDQPRPAPRLSAR